MAPSILWSFLLATGAVALNNGVGKLPKLGFSSGFPLPIVGCWKMNSAETRLTAWNVYQCDYDADMLLEQAQAMIDHGLVEAGYDVRQHPS